VNHERYVKALGRVLNFLPFFYAAIIILVPPALVGIYYKSLSVLVAALICHLIFIFIVPFYLFTWRKLTAWFRVVYTILLHRFIFHLSQLKRLNTSYADIAESQTVDDFYQQKKRSIRRRMTRTIPGKLAGAGMVVVFKSSNRIDLRNLKVQFVQARKYNKKWFHILRETLGFFSLFGDLTEYRIQGKVVGQGLGFLRGDSYTIFQYAAAPGASNIGLWFLNVYKNIEHAISLNATYINGTIELHKPEAKANSGMITCADEELVFRLYGGKFTNLPKSYYSNKVTTLFHKN
jgi:hypothetical protein